MTLQMWHVGSDKAGYFAGIVMAEDEMTARKIAWENFVNGRPMDRHADDGEEHGWKDYHSDMSELYVEALGNSYFGADSEGHLEIDRED